MRTDMASFVNLQPGEGRVAVIFDKDQSFCTQLPGCAVHPLDVLRGKIVNTPGVGLAERKVWVDKTQGRDIKHDGVSVHITHVNNIIAYVD